MSVPSPLPREPAVATFVDGFRDRVRSSAKPGQQLIDEPGVVALLGTSPDLLDGRVLVTDDRAADVLDERLPKLFARVVNVFAAAERCAALLSAHPGYRTEAAAAMVHDRLSAVGTPSLPAGLALRRVGVDPDRLGPDEVAIGDAARAALRFDPGASPIFDQDSFLAYLRSIPNAHYLAATDRDGHVRATGAAAVFGPTTSVYFVSTDPAWRRQGVGTAITAAALRVAADGGASRAVLDASALGRPIYLRLGFEIVSETTLFLGGE